MAGELASAMRTEGASRWPLPDRRRAGPDARREYPRQGVSRERSDEDIALICVGELYWPLAGRTRQLLCRSGKSP